MACFGLTSGSLNLILLDVTANGLRSAIEHKSLIFTKHCRAALLSYLAALSALANILHNYLHPIETFASQHRSLKPLSTESTCPS